MRQIVALVLGMALGLGSLTARADDVCSAEEKQASNAAIARAGQPKRRGICKGR